MFNKRSSLIKKKAPDEPKVQCEGSADPSTDSVPGETPSVASSAPAESPNLDSTYPSSFRRGLRDGTITCNVEATSAEASSAQKKVPTNLSFTDSLVEDALNNIHLRKPARSRASSVNKPRRDADPANAQNRETTNNTAEDPVEHVDTKPEYQNDEAENTPEEREGATEPEPEDYSHYAKLDYEYNCGAVELDDPLFLSSDPDEDVEIEIELAKVVKGVQDELQTARENLNDNDRVAKQNSEKLADAELEQMAFDNELEDYFELVETSKTLFDIVNHKLPAVKEALATTKANRTEEHEHLVRMRTWLYCDLLRTAGIARADYRCGELEDVDEMGRDLSLSVEKRFGDRFEAVEQLKREFISRSKQAAEKMSGLSIAYSMSEDVLLLFFPLPDRDFSLAQLSELYDHRPVLEGVFSDILADVPEKFRSLHSALAAFEKFKAKHPEEYMSLQVPNNLKVVCEFYASVALLSFNPRDYPEDPLDALLRRLPADEQQLAATVEKALLPHALDWMAYFDVESWQECLNLAEFVRYVVRYLPEEGRQSNVEKLEAALLKAIRSKVALALLKVQAAGPPAASAFNDPDLFHMLKFTVVNLAYCVAAFSRVLPAEALAPIVYDDLLVATLLPMLDLGNALDVFVVIAFKTFTFDSTHGLGRQGSLNPAVTDAYKRCLQSKLARSDSKLFNALTVGFDYEEFNLLLK